MLIDKEKIQKAKAKIGDKTADLIAEILGVDQYDENKQRGLCPFHKEDTPSFIYFPKSFSYHCFGCGKNVDIIDAYMSRGDTYVTAVQKTFEQAKVKYSLSEHLMKDKRDYRYPKEPQKENVETAYAYLNKRGISSETARYADVRQDEHGNIAFLFYDTNDVLKMVKYRPSHKISKENGDLKSWCQQGADTQPLLFNMNRVNPTEPLIITEGECDCLSLLQAGLHNSVSVPLGAQNLHWIEENWDWLEQFEEIVFCGDNDEPGVKMVKEASSRLGSWRCKTAALPDTATINGEERRIKDANECLYFLGEQALRDAIANAKDTPVASAIDFSDVEDINLGDIDGVQFGIKELDRGLMRLFYGTFNIVSGTPGSGKTSFLYQMVCNTIDNGVNCWVYSRELMSWMSRNWFLSILASPYNAVQCENSSSDNYYIVPQDVKKEISDYYRGRITLYRDDYDNDFETIIDSMINCRRKYGCKLFIIDNLMTVDLKGDDNNKNERQTMFCNRLIQFAIKYDCCVVLVAHPRKMLDPNANVGLYDVAGSSNLQNLAHRTIALRRVSDEEKQGIPSRNGNGWQKPPNPYNAMISVVKDRMRGKAGLQVGIYYDIKSRRFYTNKEEYYHQYGWQKHSNICLNPNVKYPPSEEEEKAFGEVNDE